MRPGLSFPVRCVLPTCIISFPDAWSVVSSANMSQATETFVTCSGRSLMKILNRIGLGQILVVPQTLQSLQKNMSHGGKHVAFCLQDTI